MQSIHEIEQAHRRIAPHTQRTPVVESQSLNQWLGHRILFKCEFHQVTRSFKARGACNTVFSLIENGEKPELIVANSSGNHAQAVAWAAKKAGFRSKIYIPANASQLKIDATLSHGAEVEICETRKIADERVKVHAENPGVYWIPPYNHASVVAGQGTAAKEIAEDYPGIEALFCPCGGGGLLSGSLISIRALLPNCQLFGVEPAQANDAARSLRQGHIYRFSDTPDTLADGARTLGVAPLTFEHLKLLDGFYEVGEDAIAYWTQWLGKLLGETIEPTSAMSLQAVCSWLKTQTSPKTVAVVLTGGNLDPEISKVINQTNRLDLQPDLHRMAELEVERN
jgi:threonine dehydratase